MEEKEDDKERGGEEGVIGETVVVSVQHVAVGQYPMLTVAENNNKFIVWRGHPRGIT